jgi:hypothetical protein
MSGQETRTVVLAMPMREMYFTSGPTRRLQLGAQIVELRHAPRWQLSGRQAGEAVGALHWLGRAHGASAIARLRPSSGCLETIEAKRRPARMIAQWLFN